jgi:hypothetical protein
MPRIAQATVVALATLVMTPVVANAEPMILTAQQMESVTAGALPDGINININITTQIANAKAIAVATCGVCIGSTPAAFGLAAANNANASGQLISR